jgi:hypothetical protein
VLRALLIRVLLSCPVHRLERGVLILTIPPIRKSDVQAGLLLQCHRQRQYDNCMHFSNALYLSSFAFVIVPREDLASRRIFDGKTIL